MKKLYAIAAFTLISAIGLCQSVTKFDFYLAEKAQSYSLVKIDGTEMMEVLVKGNIPAIRQLVAQSNGKFKYAYGNIAAVVIPVSALPAFNSSKGVVRVEGAPPHIQPMNDTMRMRSHIVEVQMGMAPLTMPYTGKGVIVGMIDTGIDIVHMDFQDSTGKTRIKSLWDMNQPTGHFTPAPYGYGKAWNNKQIDSVLATKDSASIASVDSASSMDYGHGSHVSGVATGNGRSNHSCIGAAPDADIMMVAYNFTVQTNNEMTDAANYIYTQADMLGEPCVINASLGDYAGSHDGFDLQAQMIDSMITAKPGRVFVAASGNGSNIPYHLGGLLNPGDTSFTWFGFNGSNVDIQLFADTASFRNVQFAIGVDNPTPFSYRAHTGFSNIFPYLGKIVTDTIKNAFGARLGILQYYGQLMGKTYEMEFTITPDSTNYYWRLITTGQGKFDVWYPDPTAIIDTALPSVASYPDMKFYKMPDTVSTLCSSFQCSPNVITVGDYYNRKSHLDYDTVLYYGDTMKSHVEGALVGYSGVGPTRDGRIKPDITSPGDYCMSVLPTTLRDLYIQYGAPAIDTGGHHYLDGGTSTASPGVAGTAALYLQMNPTANNIEVKNAIIYCSTQDAFTGFSLPDNHWGFGKVNAFKALTGCTLAVHNITPQPVVALGAYPNPMKDGTVIEYDFTTVKEYCTAEIAIYDVMGKLVKVIDLKNSKGTVPLSKGSLSPATYFYSLKVDDNTLKTEKLLVL